MLTACMRPFFPALAVSTFVCVARLMVRLFDIVLRNGFFLAGPALEMFAAALPGTLFLTIPMSLLAAILLGAGKLAANGEILAIRACGVSLWRVIRPLMLLSAAFFLLLVWAAQRLIPALNLRSSDLATQIQFRVLSALAPETAYELVGNGKDNDSWIIFAHRDAETGDMREVVIASNSDANTTAGVEDDAHRMPGDPGSNAGTRSIIFSSRGRIEAELSERMVSIFLTSGTMQVAGNSQQRTFVRFDHLRKGVQPLFSRTAAGGFTRAAREMTMQELRDRILNPPPGRVPMKWMTVRQAREEFNETRGPDYSFAIEYYMRFALPMACVAFAVLAVGLADRIRPRRTSLAWGISFIVILLYYGMMNAGMAFGKTGNPLTPYAIFLPNIVFLGLGAVLLRRALRGR
ncbi:MAG: LptF/LptG family permease [Candidatus Sumerlaeota bacterium]|nr:LptF/LptG family permease [Candidatus Sumerlaeota bacterium]